MTNEQIARIVASLACKPKTGENDPNFAVQLLVEKLFVPSDIECYTEEAIFRNINWHLSMEDEIRNEEKERNA